MDMGTAMGLMRSAIFQILVLSAPLLLVGLVVGLIISIFQATTSIQEQTLTFVPKIAAILITLMFLGPWMMAMLVNFTTGIFNQISVIGG
ncbi:flagellar biosynthesis protein FliQ [Salinispira pacifica]|uniref:Flagellar biosynthetic protein FliQ n=1 Tax=Salinispira pacifica TaxID=1307761 RepID=V5WFP2_9SPIO|nr:flagellar biosynthesis protein FliQ [Salinispira pacifica]AHC14598.1 Flagellar biosynthesis protein FliQ [Salinispira pacifica]